MSKDFSIWKPMMVMYLVVMLSACNLPAPAMTGEEESPAIVTMTSQAVEALIQTQLAPTATLPPTEIPKTIPTAIFTPTESPPSPTPTVTTDPSIEFCTDKAAFEEDVTVEDGTIFSPGADFTKTWRLKNIGTCAWTPQYTLVFHEGDQMNAANEIPLTGYVDAETTIDLSVVMKAPAENGFYQGQWMIRSADGKLFGIGKEADKPFWVKITVSESASELDLGTPAWLDSFENASKWYLLDTNNTQFSVKNGHMVLEAFNAGEAEEWGLSTAGAIKDFYMEATFKTGEACSGRDRYGILFRAPDPNMGYVMGFSCDGKFRLYKWDGEHYLALQEWKQAAQIVSGPNQTNRMGILAQGSTIKVYANGKLLGEFVDNTYDKGRFGLFIGSAETDNLKVYVDDLAYWLVGE